MRRALPALALAVVWVVATTVGPTSVDVPSDLPIYRGYAEALRVGLVPYRDFALEYPPLALVPIGLAGAFGVGQLTYAWVLGVLLLGAALVAQRAAAQLAGGGRRGEAVAWGMVLLPIAAGAIVRTRFDLVPAALTLAGLAAILARRPAAGFALLGLGTATKLFPAVVAAATFAWLLAGGRRRAAGEGALAFGGVLALTCLPFLVAAPDGFLAQFAFHLERPVQIESAPATVLWALGDSVVTGTTARPDRFRSNGLAGGADGLVLAVFAALQLAAVLAAVALTARRPGDPHHLVLGSFAGLLAFVALGKVLSPQYGLWLAPLALVVGAQGARWPAGLVLLAVPVTQLEFPTRYLDLVQGETAAIVLVGVRNALLLAALVLVLSRLAGSARSTPPAAAGPGRSG